MQSPEYLTLVGFLFPVNRASYEATKWVSKVVVNFQSVIFTLEKWHQAPQIALHIYKNPVGELAQFGRVQNPLKVLSRIWIFLVSFRCQESYFLFYKHIKVDPQCEYVHLLGVGINY